MICRIPGRLKRKLWVKEGDIVIVEPWELGGDKKGDIVFEYKHSQIDFVYKNGTFPCMHPFKKSNTTFQSSKIYLREATELCDDDSILPQTINTPKTTSVCKRGV